MLKAMLLTSLLFLNFSCKKQDSELSAYTGKYSKEVINEKPQCAGNPSFLDMLQGIVPAESGQFFRAALNMCNAWGGEFASPGKVSQYTYDDDRYRTHFIVQIVNKGKSKYKIQKDLCFDIYSKLLLGCDGGKSGDQQHIRNGGKIMHDEVEWKISAYACPANLGCMHLSNDKSPF